MDLNTRYDIHTYVCEIELGAVISQNVKPIASYSRKVTEQKTRYTVTEKELLGIFKTLKKFCTILLGQQLKLCTDQKCNMKNFNTD